MNCPHCSEEHPENLNYCPNTGLLIEVEKIICLNCGCTNPGGLDYCRECGANLNLIEEIPKEMVAELTESGDQGLRKRNFHPIVFVVLIAIGIIIVLFGFIVFWLEIIQPQNLIAVINSPDFVWMNINSPTETELEKASGVLSETLSSSILASTSLPSAQLPSKTISPWPTSAPSPSYTLTPTPIILVNSIDGAELVFIPAGEFIMGSDPGNDPWFLGAEKPSHQVYLNDYWINRTEVTNGMYKKCTDAKACPQPSRFTSNTRKEYFGNMDYLDYPVVYVDWENANTYCKWIGGRLPTEAEWEKAARGVDGRLFPWGNNPPGSNLANFGTQDTMRVASFLSGASPYGAFDMAGNVLEWVFDRFKIAYTCASPCINPLGPSSGDRRVFRGGAYHNTEINVLRVVARGSLLEDHKNVDVGFRCVSENVR